MLNWKNIVKIILFILWTLITGTVIVSLPVLIVGILQGLIAFSGWFVVAYFVMFIFLVLSFGLIVNMDVMYD